MLDSLKRWIAGNRQGPEGRNLEGWARQRKLSLKRVRDNGGLVIEGALLGKPWRMEWGPPQRDYIEGRELRLRMDLGLPPELQMAVLSKTLAETLEQRAYAVFTQDTQTRIDSGMPEEVRWLAMFPKTAVPAMRPVRARFSSIAVEPESLTAWLDTDLAAQLEAATREWLAEAQPFVMMTLRGRLYLRTAAAQPDVALLDGVLALVEVAARRAQAAGDAARAREGLKGRGGSEGTGRTTAFADTSVEAAPGVPGAPQGATAWGPLPPLD
jgi:hypothetical protein